MKGRVVFITGASQGIGRACALEFARDGASVVVGARQQDKLASLVNEITDLGGSALAVPLDVAEKDSIKEAFSEARESVERIDILVNNAGITRDGLAVRMSTENWSQVMDTNLNGAFACIQAVLPSMMKARWGRIINISGLAARQSGNTIGSIRNVAVVALTKNLADELGPKGINVTVVFMVTFIVGSILGALGGAYLAPTISVSPGIGVEVIVLSFAVVVIGGMGSIPGAIIGALLVGISRAAAVHKFPEIELFVIYAIMALVWAFRPEGLFAPAQARKI